MGRATEISEGRISWQREQPEQTCKAGDRLVCSRNYKEASEPGKSEGTEDS